MQLKFPKTIVGFIKGLKETTYSSCLLYLSNFCLAIGYNALLLYALVWESGNIVNLPTKRIGFYNFCLWNQKAELDCLMNEEIEKLGISNIALGLSRLCVYISPVLCLFSATTIIQQSLCFKDRDGWKLAQILLSVSSMSLPAGLLLFIFSPSLREMLRILTCALLIPVVCSIDFVTCGSVLKLQNQNEGSRLHSHDVKYGSGSGQQSVTAVPNSDDINSHWQLHPALGDTCARGVPVQCGSSIRLQHLTTGCFLHSHHFQAPLSKSTQEVSCFGTPTESDTGDNWQLLCSGDSWEEADAIKLKHVDTGVFLALSGNKFGRPIHGQREVVGVSSSNSLSYWVAAEGVYMSS